MIIFIYGADSYRSRQKLKEIKNKFKKDVDISGNSLNILDGEKLTLENLNEKYSANSLFTKKRMVIVERIFSNKNTEIQNSICDFLKEREGDENIIVFWDDIKGEKMGKNRLFKFLEKTKLAEKFNNLSGVELINWIKAKVNELNFDIDNQAISLLCAYFENDMWRLKNEIDKLVSYKYQAKEEERTITKNDIIYLCSGKMDENIFALTDAISSRNKALALELLEKEIEGGMSGEYLLYMISRQFKILLELKDALEFGKTINEIKSSFKMHPYVIQKSLSQAGNFELQTLRNINDGLIRIEKAIKRGKADARLALSVIISRI